jgi:hypothetical protein
MDTDQEMIMYHNEMKMCRNEIENDHLYKEVMERIDDEWETEKLLNPRKHLLICNIEYIDRFKNEQSNQENSGELYHIEFDNIKQLMLYQKWCYLSVIENFGTCENNMSLFDMRELKNQVIYWIMKDFESVEEDWDENEEDEEDEE